MNMMPTLIAFGPMSNALLAWIVLIIAALRAWDFHVCTALAVDDSRVVSGDIVPGAGACLLGAVTARSLGGAYGPLPPPHAADCAGPGAAGAEVRVGPSVRWSGFKAEAENEEAP